MKFVFLILILLLYNILQYLRNLVFAQKIKVFEKLLDSRLRCTFGFIISNVKICGEYKNRRVEFISRPRWIFRHSVFTLTTYKLPKQKKLMVNYPKFTQNVYLRGNKLIYHVSDFWNVKFCDLGKARFVAILDELLYAAEIAERADKRDLFNRSVTQKSIGNGDFSE